MATATIGSGPGLSPFDVNINGTNHTVANIVYQFFLIFTWVIGIASIISLLFAGWKYISASGDTEKAGEARQQLLFSVIGILLASGSYMIYQATIHFLG